MYAATFKPREEDPASENILVSPYVELQLGHVQLAYKLPLAVSTVYDP
jgi:hypothetical protein